MSPSKLFFALVPNKFGQNELAKEDVILVYKKLKPNQLFGTLEAKYYKYICNTLNKDFCITCR